MITQSYKAAEYGKPICRIKALYLVYGQTQWRTVKAMSYTMARCAFETDLWWQQDRKTDGL